MTDTRVPSISIEGKATIVAKADTGFVDLYTRADGMLLEDAIAESLSKTERIVGTIKASGFGVKEILVTDVQIGERKPVLPASKDSPKPEVINNILVTILPSPGTAAKIVDTASRLGASLQNPIGNVFGGGTLSSAIMYGLVDRDAIEESAMNGAIEDAQKTAARTAKLVGKGVGRILGMSKIETSGTGTRAMGIARKGKDSKFATDYLSLSPEKIEVTASLTIVLELLDSQCMVARRTNYGTWRRGVCARALLTLRVWSSCHAFCEGDNQLFAYGIFNGHQVLHEINGAP